MPSFVAAGALGNNATVPTQAIAAPACLPDDILIACMINKALTVRMSPPDGTWNLMVQDTTDCTTAADDHVFAMWWHRAVAADSGASFTFTKDVDDNVLFAGVISAWRGCDPIMPFDGAGVLVQKNIAAADAVTFAAIDPLRTDTPHIVFVAFYGNDLTTFAAALSTDVNPDCTVRWDLETATGNDCSIACASGDNDGSAIASLTWASASTTDAGSTGVVFALVPVAAVSAGTTGSGGAFSPMGGW